MTTEVYFPPDTPLRPGRPTYEELSKKAEEDPIDFWAGIARELEWFQDFQGVFEGNGVTGKWFLGGKCNIVANALDRHAKTWRKNKLAILWEGENGKTRTLSYHALNREVTRLATVLKSMGINKGDRVTIYMPRIPEQVIAMLATAKIGAIHIVVYGGFSTDALRERMMSSESRLLITADGGYMNGKVVPLKEIATEAINRVPSLESVIVVKHIGQEVSMEPGRDYFYHDLTSLKLANLVQTEPMDAEDPLFILYTSGTTGKPKGVVHVHGGYMVGAYCSTKWVFDIRDEDRYFCTADPGWITGHTYVTYGPLMNGATLLLYEGGPSTPYPDRWWQLIAKYGISIFYTTPTAIRGLMRYGDAWPKRHDLRQLRLLGSVGEPINPAAWKWFHRAVGDGQCPIMDTYWQTETGMICISPLPETPLKPGSCAKPLPGMGAEILTESGEPCGPNEEGYLVLTRPFPSLARTLYKDPEEFQRVYFSKFPGKYFTGDTARLDEDGYFWVIGRSDEIIKVSGYRLGTAEVESGLVSHPAVAEAAVIGVPHDIKGNVIKAFVALKPGSSPSIALEEELKAHVGHEVGPIAKPESILFVDNLPKTRSGKILRRLLRAKELGLDTGDVSTLEE